MTETQAVFDTMAKSGERRRRLYTTSPRREASLFKLGRNLGSGHFLCWRDEMSRSHQSSRQQVKEAPDQTADQCSVYADVLQVITDNQFNPVGETAGIPLPHDLD